MGGKIFWKTKSFGQFNRYKVEEMRTRFGELEYFLLDDEGEGDAPQVIGQGASLQDLPLDEIGVSTK